MIQAFVQETRAEPGKPHEFRVDIVNHCDRKIFVLEFMPSEANDPTQTSGSTPENPGA